jgi:hypothetical protein
VVLFIIKNGILTGKGTNKEGEKKRKSDRWYSREVDARDEGMMV